MLFFRVGYIRYNEENLKGDYSMTSIKEFYKKYREPILITGCVVCTAVAAVILTKAHVIGKIERLDRGKSILKWGTPDSFMSLERSKEILDLNANNSERFAIFRDGSIPEDYVCITISDNVVFSK